MWWMWGIVIVIALGSIFTYLPSPAKGVKETKRSRSAAGPAKKAVARSLSEDATKRLRGKILDQMCEDNYASALNNITKLLESPHYIPDFDGEHCAEDFCECFSCLAGDKQPAQCLKFFDSLRKKSSVIDHALQHDKQADLSSVFCESLSEVDHSTLTVAQGTALLDLLESGHELVEMTKLEHENQVLDFVNELAGTLTDESQAPWEYPNNLATALQLLRERLPKPKKRKEKNIDKKAPAA